MKKMILLISMIIVFSSSIYSDGPATVNLGTANHYAILAKTGVSTTGTTDIVGSIGISPAAATFVTGFDLIMDPSGTYSTSALVTGNIFAADYTDPTPSNLTTAIGDMEIAYTDAAGRLDPDYTELYAGDLTGQTLTPGLYKWSSGILISAGGLTIAGAENDTWIFQISQDLTVADGAIIALSGGAQPENIFWQVAGQISIGTTAQFKGIILCQTLISLNTGATTNGRLLAQTAITLDANSVVEPVHFADISDGEIPVTSSDISLVSNYPNPFNPTTTIYFNLPTDIDDNTEIVIYNSNGQKVKSFGMENFSADRHSVFWNGTDDNNIAVSSGVYFYRLHSGEFMQTRRMILMK
ncbi:MAG: ice-binding family protein [Candidatus Cloacimonetes bacterium]|nr:ice-binding family protein [Candidatus Cloacimonadota bacterium]